MMVCQRGLCDKNQKNAKKKTSREMQENNRSWDLTRARKKIPGRERFRLNTTREVTTMADFVQKTIVKTATRQLANPIADVAAFNTIVESVLTDNPFGCVAYATAGVSHPGVEKSKETYMAKIVYQDADAKIVGTDSGKFNSIAGFNAGATALLASTALTTAHGGTPFRDTENETYSATIRCRDPNGELYMLTISRDSVGLSSYSDESIRTKVETWADTVPALA